ncbi:MAG: hypothetical protein H6767_04600 [Candidatus Peribacteria bacterium]|nr:MAG: hypothetical protein H6767_04600 [Candidatus Peribacteria bacterium]
MIRSFAQDRFGWDTHGYYLYKYKQDIYLTDKRIHPLWERVFLYRIGIHI